jgi:hypothetical protein
MLRPSYYRDATDVNSRWVESQLARPVAPASADRIGSGLAFPSA